ncbi:MAG: hypothetical protein AABY53_03415 [Bdellovibrionota bacterium]
MVIEKNKRFMIKKSRSPFLTGETIADMNKALVLQAIIKLNQAEPINTLSFMRVNKGPMPDPVLTEALRRPTSRKFLHFAGIHFYGSWNTALRAANVKPIKTSYNKFWNKSLIVASIKCLNEEGYSLAVKSIWRDRSRKTSRILKRVTGKLSTAAGLHDAGRRYFGSWDEALMSAGIDPAFVKEKPFWSEKKIIQSIKQLDANGVRLNSEKMGRGSDKTISAIIKKATGFNKESYSLHAGAYRIFGSWDRALQYAGVDPSNHRIKKFSWNSRQVGRILNVLHELEIPINSSSVSRDTSTETYKIIQGLTGQDCSALSMYRFANKKFGSWDAALKYSGFMLSEIRRSGSPCTKDEQKLISIIRAFHKNDLALNRSALISRSNQVKFFIEQNFGPPVSGTSLIKAAHDVFGSWDNALWGAGFDVDEIRLRARPNLSNLSIISYQLEDTKRDGVFSKVKYFGDPVKTPEQIMEESEKSDVFQSALSLFDVEEQALVDKVFDAILRIHHYKDQEQLINFVVEELDHSVSAEVVRNILRKLASKLEYIN